MIRGQEARATVVSSRKRYNNPGSTSIGCELHQSTPSTLRSDNTPAQGTQHTHSYYPGIYASPLLSAITTHQETKSLASPPFQASRSSPPSRHHAHTTRLLRISLSWTEAILLRTGWRPTQSYARLRNAAGCPPNWVFSDLELLPSWSASSGCYTPDSWTLCAISSSIE